MKILAIGDVTGIGGVEHLEAKLWSFRKREGIDLCIVNAENAAFVTGASQEIAERLLFAGADCLTGGNHTLRNRGVFPYLEQSDKMLRPINFGSDAPGSGYTVVDCLGYRVMVICAMGNVHIEPTLDSPFGYIDRLLDREAGRYDLAILDIHAEATGEKLAIAHAYDGRINIIFGTHTHVQTADECVLPKGTGYITDLGMCGESGGILGMSPESVVPRMRSHIGFKFEPATGAPEAQGAIFDLDQSTGRVRSVRRVKF
jgi:metallophosphoesterase (TIGR00282 family)